MVHKTATRQMMMEGSQLIFNISFWLYPPILIIRGTVGVAMGVIKAVREPVVASIMGPTGL